MKSRLTALVCWLFIVFCVVFDSRGQDSAPAKVDVANKREAVARKIGTTPRMGLNLAGVCDWNTELPFADVFHETRQWISQKRGTDWGKGPELKLDARGWVTRLEKDCWAEVPLCTIEGGHYPSGVFMIEYEGEGKLEFGNGSVVSEEPGRIQLKVDSSNGAFWLRIMETNPENYIRNIRVYLPGLGDAKAREKTGVWNPDFLKRWKSIAVFRTMDWQSTNGSSIRTWADRPIPEDAVYTRAGLPIETI